VKRAELEALLERIAAGDETALETLLAFLETRSAGTRVLFLEALAIEDEEEMWEAIMLTLADDDLPQIAPLAETEAAPPPDLLDTLRSAPARQARVEAARALASWRDPRTVSALVEALADDLMVAAAAVEALVEVGAPAVPPLVEALQAHDVQVRRHAAKALSRLGDARAVDALIEALEDPNYSVRWLAAEGLVTIGREAVLPLLRALSTRAVGAWLRQGAFHVLNKVEASGDEERRWLRRLAGRVRRAPAAEVPLLARRALAEWERLWTRGE